MKKLKSGDPVKVIAGKFKGKTSKIVSVDGDLVVVDGINVMKKAVKGKGFVDKIKPIHISNIAYLDDKAGTSKIGITVDAKGKKVRVLKKTQKAIA
jgi:large subunit ribosomal protein L24